MARKSKGAVGVTETPKGEAPVSSEAYGRQVVENDKAWQAGRQVRQDQVDRANRAAALHPSGNSNVTPERDQNGNLTRAGYEAAIRAGGSATYKGRPVMRMEDIPSDAELSEGDEEASLNALASIEAQEARLKREKEMVQSRFKAAKSGPRAAAPRTVPTEEEAEAARAEEREEYQKAAGGEG
jgi:hypothetical protein